MQGLSGLGNVRGGYLTTQSQDIQNQQQQLQLDQAKSQVLVQGLQGDALMLLAGGGGGQGPAAQPGGRQQSAPAPMVPSPAPPAPTGPMPGGSTPTEPSPSGAYDPRADTRNPSNWDSFQVESGPGAGTGGTLESRPNVAQAQAPGAMVPGNQVPTQSFRPPSGAAAAPQGGGAPPGGGTAPAPSPGGAPQQQQPTQQQVVAQALQSAQQGGGITLDRVIAAVAEAARRRGQQITPDLIFRAVAGFAPLFSAEDKLRYQLAIQEYKDAAKDRQIDAITKRMTDLETQRQGGRLEVQAAKTEGQLETTVERGEQNRETEDVRQAGRKDLQADKAAAAMERATLSANTKKEIAGKNNDTKLEIANILDAGRSARTDKEIAGRIRNLDVTVQARREIAEATAKAAQTRVETQQEGQTGRTLIQEGGRQGRFQSTMDQRERFQDQRTQYQQQLLTAKAKNLEFQQGKSLMTRYFAEHPNATVEDWQAFQKSGRPPSAAEERAQTQDRLAGSIETQIDSALADVTAAGKGGPWVTGIAGDFTRAKEIAGNVSGFSDEATALTFGGKVELLKSMAPRLLINTARLSNKERSAWDSIVRGTGLGATRQDTAEALNYLKEVIHEVFPGGKSQYGTQPGAEPKAPPKAGDTININDKDYKFKGGDPLDPANYELKVPGKEGRRSTRTRLASNEEEPPGGDGLPKDMKPPPSLWNWLNTDAPPGLKEWLEERGYKGPPKKKVEDGGRSYA